MFAENIHHHFISLFLIITFFTFTICIQNANLIDSHDNNRNHQFQSSNNDDWIPMIMSPMARQRGGNYYEDNTISAGDSERGSFAFPTNDVPYAFEHPNANPNTNKNIRPPPSNYDNYYSSRPYSPQQKQQPQQQQQQQYYQQPLQYQQQKPHQFQSFNSNLNSNLQNVPGYDNYRKTTYQQNYPNYAQNHGIYLNNNQRPNYYRPPQSQPPPPPQRPIRPTPPARPPPNYFGGGSQTPVPQQSNSQYASQFSNFLGPLSNLLGGGGASSGTPASSNSMGNNILQGLEQISRNDDLECVPKVLCQMVGNPQRRVQLPSYITSPGLQAIISALPAASPALIYGRAALLGLTGGERTCSSTYTKCPRDEDEVLYYLNNHRGGFFKFFNEPGGSPYKPTASTSQSPLGLFMNLFGGNTNSGVSSLMGSAGNTLGSFFGNILQGLAGGTTMYARRAKRDIERRILTDVKDEKATEETTSDEEDDDDSEEEADEAKMIISVPEDEEKDSEDEGVEGRILNKGKIQAYSEDYERPSSFVKFPYHEEEGLRYGRLYDPSEEYNNYVQENNQPEDTLKFSQDHRYAKQYFYDGNYPEQSGTKVVFPENSDSGSLRFDNHRISSTSSKVRFGKILNRPNYNSNNYHSNDADNYNNNYYNRRPYYSRRDYGTTNDYRRRTTPKPDNDFEGNIYVTNSKGVVEYYLNKQGRKVYV
ncbi:hypothetical protein ACFFRR_011673 [Megaselia abdita]